MKVTNAAVDWLTMTSKEDRIGAKWWELYSKYKSVRRKEGNEEKSFHNGFYGGVRTASMSVGYSDAIGYIVVISGGDAERLYRRLQPGKHKVTRLDLCIDFYFAEPVKLAKRLYRKQERDNKNKQRKFSIYEGSDGGATFYLGSRQSLQFGRVYDKGVQTRTVEPGKFWRAEVEYKKPVSGSIARALSSIGPGDRELVICDTVCEWFADRNSTLFPRQETSNSLHISVQSRVTTADRKLAWLRSQVAPSVAQLIELGYGKKVLDVLSLDVETLSDALSQID